MKRLMFTTALISMIAAPAALAEPTVDADAQVLPANYSTEDLNRFVLANMDGDNETVAEELLMPQPSVEGQLLFQTETEIETGEANTTEMRTIVDVAKGDPRFSTVVSLVAETGLNDVLEAEGSFTVFAPTNDAFEALPEEQLNYLMSETGRDDLIGILKIYITTGELDASAVPAAGLDLTTLADTQLDITRDGDVVIVEGSEVVVANIATDNGIIHAIDKVIVPEGT